MAKRPVVMPASTPASAKVGMHAPTGSDLHPRVRAIADRLEALDPEWTSIVENVLKLAE